MPQETVFEQKVQAHFARHPLISERALWLKTILFAFVLIGITYLYNALSSDDPTLHLINRSLADSALILIGFSFALSGICYFWNFADHFIIYRKHLGLIGFALALSHGIASLIIIPIGNLTPFVSALLALMIYTGMALISNKYAMHELGGERWRRLLRVGYLAYVLTITHFSIRSFDDWIEWTHVGLKKLPPLSLLLFFFTLVVLGLRIAVFFSHARTTTEAQSSAPKI